MTTRNGDLHHADFGRWHSADALACWGSVSKVLLAALTRALVERGNLTWDTTVGELTGMRAPDALTVEALVSHRSGLPRLLPEQARMIRDPYGPFTDERFDAEVLPRLNELAAKPTTESEYSNLGYAVLTRALEIAEGRSWIEMLRELVVVPAGLEPQSVTLDPGTTQEQGAAVVRARSLAGRVLDEWDLSTGPFSGAGGLWASIATMSALARTALEPGSPLDPLSGTTAWIAEHPRFWHNGAVMRSGGIVVVDVMAETVTIAHSVGGLPTGNATRAEKLAAAVMSAQVGGRQ